MVPVPRRQIEARAKPFGRAGVDELPHDVAIAAAERAGGNGVSSRSRRPEAEAIVMLRRENQGTKAGRFRRPSPLSRVETRRIEDGRVLPTISPLAVGERVHPEVEKHRQLVTLPGELRRARQSERGSLM